MTCTHYTGIDIDTREPVDKISDILAGWNHGKIPDVKFLKLDLGDYLICNGDDIIVERKEMADLVSSHQVLRKRMDKMRKEFNSTVLLVEGTYQVKNNRIYLWRGNTLTDVWGYQTYAKLIARQQSLGTMYVHTMNLEESLLWLFTMFNNTRLLEHKMPASKRSG